ncbi:MAG: sulfotransferase [Gemmatimonadetes bacterium]|nr:sulfotransferase [Gemmatimonadota bacterium]
MTLPNFLMIGAQKSGTTAIYAYLDQHPEIFMSENKEPGFFALDGLRPDFGGPGDARGERNRVRDVERYKALFRGAAGRPRAGEASNIYLYLARARDRILSYIPTAKLVAVLRDPVERAYSAYRHLVRDGREPLASFEEALAAEPARISANWHPHWHYKQRGFYYTQLKRYFDAFERDQIAVYTYDDFRANPRAVLRSIFLFLGVDPDFEPDLGMRHNVSGVPRSRLLHAMIARPSGAKDLLKRLVPVGPRRRLHAAFMKQNIVASEPKITEETQRALRAEYSEDILELEKLLGRDLSAWRTGRPSARRTRWESC